MSFEPRFAMYNDIDGEYGYVRGLMVCFETEGDAQTYLSQMRADRRLQEVQAPWRAVDMRHPNNVLHLETTPQGHRYLLWCAGQLTEQTEDHLGALTEHDLDEPIDWDE